MSRWLALALVTACATGCVSVPTSAPAGAPVTGDAVATAEAAQRARARALGLSEGDCDAPVMALGGRVALSNGRDGGSGQFDWTQGGGATHLLLTAPVTRQGWALDVDATGATLTGVPNGPLRGTDAATLLRQATGWDIPVAALGCWLRAVEAGSATFGAARVAYGADLLPQRIEQAGWVVDYAGWQADPVTRLAMPARITAQRGENRVRLVVDRWGDE